MPQRDHRTSYTPTKLLVNGRRMTGGHYEPKDALEDYMAMHPDADEAKVRRSLLSSG